MKKYKLLRIGRCYLNKEGNLAIALVKGSKKRGYWGLASASNSIMYLHDIQIMSRIVPNDGNWTEIGTSMFSAISAIHLDNKTVTLPPDYKVERKAPVIRGY